MEPREREELQQEGFGDGRGVGRPSIERPHPGQEQHEQPHVALVLLGDLVDGFQHGLSRGEQPEVAPESPERRHDLGLADGVEGPSPPVDHEGNVRERLQPGAEPRGRLPDALGHGSDLARALGHDRDDLVGLAQLDRAQHDALFLVEGHARIVAPGSCRSRERTLRSREDNTVQARRERSRNAREKGERDGSDGSAASRRRLRWARARACRARR
jgi:hypothetical protein